MRAVLLQAKFSGGAFRAPHETANAPPPRILRLRRKTAPKMKNRSRDPHHAPKGAADFAARRRQIILIVFGATCACQKTLLTERSVRACGACMQRSAISSKKEDGFCSPLTGVTTNSGDTPTGYRVYDACRGSSVFRGCRLSISCCWLSTKPMPL